MKNIKKLMMTMLLVVGGLSLVACDGGGECDVPKADLIVNNVKTTHVTFAPVYFDGEDFVITHRAKMVIVNDTCTLAEVRDYFLRDMYGFDFNSYTQETSLAYGAWPNITNAVLPTDVENFWAIRNSNNQVIADLETAAIDNATYYYSYEKIENPDPFVVADLVAPAKDDDKTFYLNNVSTKTVDLLVKAKKTDGTDEVLINQSVQYTTTVLTFEKVLKTALEDKGIQYAISSGFISAIGNYSNGMEGYGDGVYAYFHSGTIVDGELMGVNGGVHQCYVGDGASLQVYFW